MGRECLSTASQLDPVYSRQEGMRIGLIMDLVLPTQTPSPVTEVTNEGIHESTVDPNRGHVTPPGPIGGMPTVFIPLTGGCQCQSGWNDLPWRP